MATLATLRLDEGRAADGLAEAEEGLRRCESMGGCSHFFRGALLRLRHAECLEGTGEKAAARAAIASAADRILEVAEKIDDPAYRTSFLEGVPENRRTIELARQWLGEERWNRPRHSPPGDA